MKSHLHQWILVAVTLLGMLPVSAYDFQVDGIYYNINGDEVTVTNETGGRDGFSYSGVVVIPSSVTYEGKTYAVTRIGKYAFDSCGGLTSVTIGNLVTSLEQSAFSFCTGLTSVTIPNSVKSIGRLAFYNCSSLTSLMIPNSVKSIGDFAFSSCSRLTSIEIPNSVESIGDHAFFGCSGLTSVTIGNSVESIGDQAFSSCSELTSVTIGDSVKSIGDFAFTSCSRLTSIEIPNSVTSIGDAAFYICSGLTSVTIGNSVTSIGEGAFYSCSSLTSIEIPNSVTSIGDGAFYGCSELQKVYSFVRNPPTIQENTFGNYMMPLYVPAGCTGAYQEAEYWKNFTDIVEMPSGIESISDSDMRIYVADRMLHVENGEVPYRVYSVSGQLIYSGNDSAVRLSVPGIYVVQAGNSSQKVIVK